MVYTSEVNDFADSADKIQYNKVDLVVFYFTYFRGYFRSYFGRNDFVKISL